MSNKRKREIQFGGVGINTVLFTVFLVLKLVGVINWSWWWVFAPLWIPLGLAIVLILGVLLFYWSTTSYYRMKERKKKRK